MPVKVNVGLAKKIGQPDYGSLGATCHVEFELDGGFDNGSSAHFQDAVRRAYVACRQAVETEIEDQRLGGNLSRSNGSIPPERNGFPSSAQSASQQANGIRQATASQVRAIHAIARRVHVDLDLMLAQFGVAQPADLCIRDASKLIDQLKSGSNQTARHSAA